MPVYIDVLKFKGETPANPLRLIASGGFYRLGSPFARFSGIAHAAAVSRFSSVLAIHRPVARKTVAARCGNAIGAPTVWRGSGARAIGGPSVSAATGSHSGLTGIGKNISCRNRGITYRKRREAWPAGMSILLLSH